MKERLAKLLEVKSLMSLSATAVFVYLAVTMKMDIKDSMIIILLVYQFFFQHQQKKDTNL
jgi:hypothetical protein